MKKTVISEFVGLHGVAVLTSHPSKFCVECREQTPDVDGVIHDSYHFGDVEIIYTTTAKMHITGKPEFSNVFRDYKKAIEDYKDLIDLLN